MLGNVKVSSVPRYPGGRNAWTYSRSTLPLPPRTPAGKIEARIALAQDTTADQWKPEFPFPLDGPLMPAPRDLAESRGQYQRLKLALGLTTNELAQFFGLKWRTLQKWEQGRHRMDPAAWILIQLAVRTPEVRRMLSQDPPEAAHG